MTKGARFLVLCPECPLDEVHRDAAPARRTAELHHHRGATVIRISAIRAKADRKDARDLLGLILTSADVELPVTKPAPAQTRLRLLLARIA
jgi:hypothetical protein